MNDVQKRRQKDYDINTFDEFKKESSNILYSNLAYAENEISTEIVTDVCVVLKEMINDLFNKYRNNKKH